MSLLTNEDFFEALSPERKKLYWRSIKRGMKENDLILGGFAKAYLHLLTDEEVGQFADILHCFDQDIINWMTGKAPVPADLDTPIFARIKNFSPADVIFG